MSDFHCPDELLDLAWPALLARAAADDGVQDASLLQMIKDAIDHGVKSPQHPASGEGKLPLPEAARQRLVQGRKRLATLVAREAEWKALPSTKKVHRMRRAIDRRFDGPKHLRTRDFGSDSDDGDGHQKGCSVM